MRPSDYKRSIFVSFIINAAIGAYTSSRYNDWWIGFLVFMLLNTVDSIRLTLKYRDPENVNNNYLFNRATGKISNL